MKHIVVTDEPDFESRLESLAAEHGTTAAFDGLGGDLLTRLLPRLPTNSTVYVYGFLGGPAPIALPTMLIIGKNLTLRRFANLESPTDTNPQALMVATNEIKGLIDDPDYRRSIVFAADPPTAKRRNAQTVFREVRSRLLQLLVGSFTATASLLECGVRRQAVSKAEQPPP